MSASAFADEPAATAAAAAENPVAAPAAARATAGAPGAAHDPPGAARAAGAGAEAGIQWIHLSWRPFSFPLPSPLRTASGALAERRGWLLRLETAQGAVGWGEAAPLAFAGALDGALKRCARALEALPSPCGRQELERWLPQLPPAVAFALGAALAEADGLVGEAAGGWRPAPPSAWLLPAGQEGLDAARALLADRSLLAARGAGADAKAARSTGSTLDTHRSAVCAPEAGRSAGSDPPVGRSKSAPPLTLKWKVGVHGEEEERAWYGQLAAWLPPDARLRLDANGGFSRATAWRWADHLRGDGQLEWLEQPLDPADQEGLEALAERLPVALDESLLRDPALRLRWPGWQVRRPSQEGDPRPLLRALGEGRPRWMVSTSLETGIGQRWLAHLAALQAAGPTPVAPGLAPGWRALGDLGAEGPEAVWRAAGEWGASGGARMG